MNGSCINLMVLGVLVFCGCSRFESQWRQVVSQPLPTDNIAGPWEGRWTSHVNGHTDTLRAIISEAPGDDYDVTFRAAYKKGITFHFGYAVRMEVVPTNGAVAFRGSENLGWFAGGVYTYIGHATPTNFFSTYDSKFDRGIFEMKRPGPGRIPVYSATDGR
jgi:hypothetical protein